MVTRHVAHAVEWLLGFEIDGTSLVLYVIALVMRRFTARWSLVFNILPACLAPNVLGVLVGSLWAFHCCRQTLRVWPLTAQIRICCDV